MDTTSFKADIFVPSKLGSARYILHDQEVILMYPLWREFVLVCLKDD